MTAAATGHAPSGTCVSGQADRDLGLDGRVVIDEGIDLDRAADALQADPIKRPQAGRLARGSWSTKLLLKSASSALARAVSRAKVDGLAEDVAAGAHDLPVVQAAVNAQGMLAGREHRAHGRKGLARLGKAAQHVVAFLTNADAALIGDRRL